MKASTKALNLVATSVFVLLTLMMIAWLAYVVRHVVVWGSAVRAMVLLGAILLAATAAWVAHRRGQWNLHLTFRARMGVVAAVLVLGLALRIVAATAVPVVVSSDPGAYVALGKQLAQHGEYDLSEANQRLLSLRPPGYPLLLAGGYWLSGGRGWAWYAVNIVAQTMLAAFGALLVMELAGSVAGMVAFGVLYLCPLNVVTVWWGYSEVPWGAFLFAGMWLLSRCRAVSGTRGGTVVALVAGLSLGFAALIRPPALLMVPLAVAFAARQRARWSWRQPALITAGVLLAVAPWTVRNWVVQGHRFVLISTDGGEVFYATNRMLGNPQWGGAYLPEGHRYLRSICPDEVERDRLGYRLGMQEIREAPALFLRSLPYRYGTLWSTHLAGLGWARLSTGEIRVLTALLLLSYWVIPVLVLFRWRRVWWLLRSNAIATLLAAVYVMYMVALIPFEVFEKNHYPLLLVPLILGIAALFPGETQREGLLATSGQHSGSCAS